MPSPPPPLPPADLPPPSQPQQRHWEYQSRLRAITIIENRTGLEGTRDKISLLPARGGVGIWVITTGDYHSRRSPFLKGDLGLGSVRPRCVPDGLAGGLGQTSLHLGLSIWNMGTRCFLKIIKCDRKSCYPQGRPKKPEHLQDNRGHFVKCQ